MASPKRYAGTPRLEIDENGFARAVFPTHAKKRRRSVEGTAPRLLVDELGLAKAVFPNKKKKQRTTGVFAGLHLRIGRHRESYMRTKLTEPKESAVVVDDDATEDEELEVKTAPLAATVRPAILRSEANAADAILLPTEASRAASVSRDQYFGQGCAGTSAAARCFVVPEIEETDRGIVVAPLNAHWTDSTPWGHNSAGIILQPSARPLRLTPVDGPQLQFGFGGSRESERNSTKPHRRLSPEYHQHATKHVPILPPVVFFKRVDANTRLRYAVDILTIHGEKFVKADQTRFLYAVQADHPFPRENPPDVTIRQPQYAHWQADRHTGRPEVLFELNPRGELAYTPDTNRRKKAPQDFRPACDIYGRVLLNCFDRTLKYSEVMPFTVSTEIEGWEMEAICRLDPDICHQDFLDRMLPDTDLCGKVRPTKGTLNHRRRRDRMKMRILPWPLPRQLSYSDQQVVKELDGWQLEGNTTRQLQDLSKEEIEMHEAIMYGGHFERSGTSKALNDQARMNQMSVNLRLVRTKFAEESEEVNMVKARVVSLSKKMGMEGDLNV